MDPKSSDNSKTESIELAACLLLAGSLKPSPLIAETGGSVLDLYLNPQATVMDLWLDRFQELGDHLGQQPLVHVIYGTRNSQIPRTQGAASGRHSLPLRVSEDSQQYRGPAGAVKDACASHPKGSTVLVAEAARYVSGSLVEMLNQHIETRADVTVGCNPDNSPAGLFLIHCPTLELVPNIGFTDLKEQWLGRTVGAGMNVRVHRLKGSWSHELRTRETFLEAARAAGGLRSQNQLHNPGMAGQDHPAGSAGIAHSIDPGASLGAGTVVVDSIVMPGARVGAGAVIARSLVCPGALVEAGQTVVDSIVSGEREHRG